MILFQTRISMSGSFFLNEFFREKISARCSRGSFFHSSPQTTKKELPYF